MRQPSTLERKAALDTLAPPWAEAARMRDRLVHHYFDINLDVLWSTVTEDLPALLRSLQEG